MTLDELHTTILHKGYTPDWCYHHKPTEQVAHCYSKSKNQYLLWLNDDSKTYLFYGISFKTIYIWHMQYVPIVDSVELKIKDTEKCKELQWQKVEMYNKVLKPNEKEITYSWICARLLYAQSYSEELINFLNTAKPLIYNTKYYLPLYINIVTDILYPQLSATKALPYNEFIAIQQELWYRLWLSYKSLYRTVRTRDDVFETDANSDSTAEG